MKENTKVPGQMDEEQEFDAQLEELMQQTVPKRRKRSGNFL
ncbi:MAG: hypothetical protein ACLT46_17805 [Hungatella sp.]